MKIVLNILYTLISVVIFITKSTWDKQEFKFYFYKKIKPTDTEYAFLNFSDSLLNSNVEMSNFSLNSG